MSSLSQQIVEVVLRQPGITDRWLAEALYGQGAAQQRVNGECRRLAALGQIKRSLRPDGLIGNYNAGTQDALRPNQKKDQIIASSVFSEDQLKAVLKGWLEEKGWEVDVKWAKTPGIDLQARKGDARWIIEAKGSGSLDPMRVNYFLGVLGETLQRMSDPAACYSIAVPDLKQFRNLWTRLPSLAKQRTQISILFIQANGAVDHLQS